MRTSAELRREIQQTREELGETAAALGAKADVRGRAKERVEELKHRAGEKSPDSAGQAATQVRSTAQAHPLVLAAIGALVAGFAIGRLTSKS